MQAIKSLRFIAPFVFSVFALAGWIHANDSINKIPSFEVSLKNEAAPNAKPVYRAYIKAGTNEFAILIPDGYRLNVSDSEKILLIGESSFLSLRIVAPAMSSGAKLESDQCKKMVLEEHPEAEILLALKLPVGNQSGIGFDFQWTLSTGGQQIERALFIPSSVGVLKFNFVTTPDKFRAVKQSFGVFTGTFAAAKDGKLQVVPISDKI